jgi:hypothetical protein
VEAFFDYILTQHEVFVPERMDVVEPVKAHAFHAGQYELAYELLMNQRND